MPQLISPLFGTPVSCPHCFSDDCEMGAAVPVPKSSDSLILWEDRGGWQSQYYHCRVCRTAFHESTRDHSESGNNLHTWSDGEWHTRWDMDDYCKVLRPRFDGSSREDGRDD